MRLMPWALALAASSGLASAADSAYCEYAPVSQVDGCSGPNRNALRHRIGPKGVETWLYRSPGESGDPIGFYRGRISYRQWKTLVAAVADIGKRKKTSGPPGPPPPPPPGPTETISVLAFFDGKTRSEYPHSGPSAGSIGEAMDQVALLARNATDTVWQLALANPKAEVRKDSVHVTAEWKWRGPAGARILFARPAEGDLCGTAAFKWFLDTSEQVEWHRGTATPAKGRDQVWDLDGKTALVRLAFPYDGPKGKPKAKRTGMLEGIGIRLVPGGTQDTVQATVATDRFDF